jgi:hypothetical protein
MNGTGQSVSLSFTGRRTLSGPQLLTIPCPIFDLVPGTAVTVNFFPYIDGSIAQLTLDGKNVTQIDTYNVSGIGSSGYACTQLPWTSDALPAKQHTLTVTELAPNSAISIGLVVMLSFVYV